MREKIGSLRMKTLLITALLTLSACASEPYLDAKIVWQHNSGSDWMLRPNREWINDRNNPRMHIALGLAWKNDLDCPYIATGTDVLKWRHVGCSKLFGTKPNKNHRWFIETALVYQIDSQTDWWLRTDRTDWQGVNPFFHLRGGVIWENEGPASFKCPMIATGRSVTQGFPLHSESKEGETDLYWTNIECGGRMNFKAVVNELRTR
jgi:hypothetical protein